MFFSMRLSEQSHSKANGLTTISLNDLLLHFFVHSVISNPFVLIIPKLVWRSVFVVWYQPISERVLLIFTRSHFSPLSLSAHSFCSHLSNSCTISSPLFHPHFSLNERPSNVQSSLSFFPPPIIILQGGVSQLWQSHFIHSTCSRVHWIDFPSSFLYSQSSLSHKMKSSMRFVVFLRCPSSLYSHWSAWAH